MLQIAASPFTVCFDLPIRTWRPKWGLRIFPLQNGYYTIGEKIGQAWNAGAGLMKP